jgi:hypothetical protein
MPAEQKGHAREARLTVYPERNPQDFGRSERSEQP